MVVAMTGVPVPCMRGGWRSLCAALLFCASAPLPAQVTLPLRTEGPQGPPEGCKSLDYPKDAQRNEEQGAVTMAFLIGLDGIVRDSKILRSSGSRRLDEAARIGLAKCRFKPDMGQRTEAWVNVQYVWTLH